MKPYHEFTTKYPINYYRKHESKCAPSWKHLPRPYRRCLYLRYISQIGAIKAHNAPATLTLLSFVNKLCKSSAVLGALVVAVKSGHGCLNRLSESSRTRGSSSRGSGAVEFDVELGDP
jgi:hypothetical protein